MALYGRHMTHLSFNAGYTDCRCYMSTTRFCGVGEGGDLPAQLPLPTLIKTSDKYVTPVTDLKSFV